MERMQTVHDRVDPARIAALNATLGRSGDDIPPFAHQVLFWTALPEQALGRDGHPAVGNGGALIPDLGLPRRMWAGGSVEFLAPLTSGATLARTSWCDSAEVKTGRSGPVGVVVLRHEITQGTTLCLRDRQDLVYLEDCPRAARTPPAARRDETRCERRQFSTTQLFRYSALTFNGHRIHYDRDYAKEVEGYPGLVVHGPLLAQYLMLMGQEMLGGLARFDFRATAPLFDFETAEFCALDRGGRLEMWVRGPDGRQCMEASAQ